MKRNVWCVASRGNCTVTTYSMEQQKEDYQKETDAGVGCVQSIITSVMKEFILTRGWI